MWSRVMSKVVEIEGCWAWCGALANGFPAIRIRGRTIYVRRWVFRQVRGPVPKMIYRDPTCNPLCIHPHHLMRQRPSDPVTQITRQKP